MTSSDDPVEEVLERLTTLENQVKELEHENQELREKLQKLHEENQKLYDDDKRLRAKLWWYEGPHTPPSKEQSSAGKSSSSSSEDDDSTRTDGRTPGRKPGHNPAYREAHDPDREVEVTCDCCPECGEDFFGTVVCDGWTAYPAFSSKLQRCCAHIL